LKTKHSFLSFLEMSDKDFEWPPKSGFLYKMGNNVMGSFDWKKRWIVVKDNGVLYYYKSKSDSSPAGRIILKDCTVKSGTQRQFSIGLAIQSRTYYFAAETKDEYESWFNHLDISMVKKMLELDTNGPPPDKTPIVSGWLNKMGNNAVKDWPKRWCELSKEELTYWRKQDDSAPAGAIKLASLHVSQDSERANCLELVTPTRAYYFQAEDTNTVIKWAKALDTACREIRHSLGEDVLSAIDNEELHAKRVVLRAQKSAYLSKAGKNVLQQWPKRFVILRDDLLYYYKTSNDDKPLGIINLMLCTIKPSVSDKKFELILPTRTYFFATETADELTQWTEAITAAHDRIYDDLEGKSAKLQARGTHQNVSKYQTGFSESQSSFIGDSAGEKVEDNSAKDRLLEFVKQPGNNVCADCGEEDPRWASINLGVFICIDCSGIHRSMGVHISKVRSVDMDKWSSEIVEFMCSVGNTRFNVEWEASLGKYPKPTKDSGRAEREKFVNAKYNEKQFQKKPPHFGQDGKRVSEVEVLAGMSRLHANSKADVLPPPLCPLDVKPAGCQPKSGYLTKQGNSVKTWKKRWFELKMTGNSASLYYFKVKGDKMPAGIIPLLNAVITNSLHNAQKHTFEIQTPQRTFVVTASNEVEKKEWMDHLIGVVESFKAR